ncbi:MAG: class I SAM-dependent methyltransferase [Rhizobiaceae bacterium]|nr:class I SAM-dependent methyltransferase [Rhizobiaceae bacterium]
MDWLLHRVAARLIRTGSLKLTYPDGVTHIYGDGSGEAVHAVFRTGHAARAVALDPMLALPEAWMDGEFDVVEGDLLGFLRIAFTNLRTTGDTPLTSKLVEGTRRAARRLHQVNTAARARRNVHRHYDLSGEMYRLFLDADLQYSCAYFERPDMTLEDAQAAKKRHIAAKLRLAAGQNVLDIGSGWGGLGLYLAQRFDVNVLGVTLSTEQLAVAQQRAQEGGLENHVHFEMRDYRDLSERFDRIVSVGMFEHVGVNHFKAFFGKVKTLLKPDGAMLLHTIGRSGPPAATSAFIRKYIFPGGYIPALSEILPVIEKAGLVVTDVEVLRLHYAETLKAWRERFMANRERAVAIYDEHFARMWEFYLASSEASFRWDELVVFQIQLARANDSLPVTRDYMRQAERSLEMRDDAHGKGTPKRMAQDSSAARRPKRGGAVRGKS